MRLQSLYGNGSNESRDDLFEEAGMTGIFRRGLLGALGSVGVAAGTAQAQTPGASGASGDKLQEILARGHLIVGTGTDIPPFYFRDESGALAGMEIDLARLLANGLFNDPTKVEFVVQTADARIPNLLSNRIDVTIQNLTVTAGRAQQVDFSIPYYRAGQGFMLRAGGRYTSFEQLRAAGAAVTVSALQNVFVADWVHDALPEARVEQFPSPDGALQALTSGRADAHYITHSRIAWTLRQVPGRYLDSGYTNRANSIACAVRPSEARWLGWLNTALREAMTGVDFAAYAALYHRWLDSDVPAPKVGYPRELIQ
jgi:polar amino acid transport system substrate-binding protein